MRLILALIATSAVAGEPAAAPLLDLRVRDGATLTQHWQASAWGRIMADPGLAPLRTRIQQASAEAARQIGIDPLAVLPHLGVTHVRIVGTASDRAQQRTTAMFDFGTQADAFARGLNAQTAMWSSATVPGADAAWTRTPGSTVIARWGSRFVVSESGAIQRPAAVPAPAHDLELRSDPRGTPGATWTERLGGPIAIDVDFVPAGVRDRIAFPARLAGLIKPDTALLARLPARTLFAAVVGIDGAALWQEHRVWLMPALQRLPGGLPKMVEGALPTLRGTVLLAVGPGAPFPSVTLVLPRSPALDAVVAELLRGPGVAVPAEGATALLPIPGAPVAVTFGAHASGWVVTTDALLGAWTPQGDGGFAAAPAASVVLKGLPADAVLVGASNTRDVLTVGASLGMMAGMALRGEERQQLTNALGALARLAPQMQHGRIVMRSGAQGTVIEAEGLVTASTVPIAAGLLVPAVGQAKQQAQRQASVKNMQGLHALVVGAEAEGKPRPTSVAEIMRQNPEVPERITRSHGDPERTDAYLYVMYHRNSENPLQPVLVEDPACWQGAGAWACFADGHTEWSDGIKAQVLWIAAQRLAALPQARTEGITLTEWQAMLAKVRQELGAPTP